MPKIMRVFRLAHTDKANAEMWMKSDVSKFHYGKPIEDKDFLVPDHNGDRTLFRAWRRECIRLNAKYPFLHHWIDSLQPDANGNFKYPVAPCE